MNWGLRAEDGGPGGKSGVAGEVRKCGRPDVCGCLRAAGCERRGAAFFLPEMTPYETVLLPCLEPPMVTAVFAKTGDWEAQHLGPREGAGGPKLFHSLFSPTSHAEGNCLFS